MIKRPAITMAIGAHPDDIEFGAGATLAKWSAQGAQIIFVIMTDGAKGTWDPEINQHLLAVRRQKEQHRAIDKLTSNGIVEFLDAIDGELTPTARRIAQVTSLIRKYKPETIISHDPWKRYRLHPDHRNTGFIVTDAVVAARDPHFLKELGSHHRPSHLLLFEADEPNYIEPLTPEYVQAKIDALMCHESQHETSMEIAGESTDEVTRFEKLVFAMAEKVGDKAGVSLGEEFHIINDI